MSYIRCLSNPESLYIWGDCEGMINISHAVKRPLASSNKKDLPSLFTVPIKLFHAALRAWSQGQVEFERDGLTVKEVYVYTDTGRRVGRESLKQALTDKRPRENLVRLQYGKHYLHMWRVTWMYIVNQNLFRVPKRVTSCKCKK